MKSATQINRYVLPDSSKENYVKSIKYTNNKNGKKKSDINVGLLYLRGERTFRGQPTHSEMTT